MTIAAFVLSSAPSTSEGAPAHSPIIVTPDRPTDLQRSLIAALEARGAYEIRPMGHLALLKRKPRAFFAIGDDANAAVADRWPEIPRAALLVWDLAHPATHAAQLVYEMRPGPECTAQHLQRDASEARWIVLAAADDRDAAELAKRLNASLLKGSPREVRADIEAELGRGATRLWLRASPLHMDPVWLKHLTMLQRAGVYVGTDAPGLAGAGFETPVKIDIDALAEFTVDWSRGRRSAAKRRESPCTG